MVGSSLGTVIKMIETKGGVSQLTTFLDNAGEAHSRQLLRALGFNTVSCSARDAVERVAKYMRGISKDGCEELIKKGSFDIDNKKSSEYGKYYDVMHIYIYNTKFTLVIGMPGNAHKIMVYKDNPNGGFATEAGRCSNIKDAVIIINKSID